MKKWFCLVVILLVFFSGVSFAQNKFEFGLKYENFSYLSNLFEDFDLVNVSCYDWYMATKLQQLQGEESISRLLFQTSYSSPILRLTAIVGVGNLAYNYYDGTIQQRETFVGWSRKFERNYDLVPLQRKSNLGLVFGGEIGWNVISKPFTASLNARYIWQDEAQSDSNLFYEFGEGFAYLQYGYHLQQADIQKTAHSEFMIGVTFSKKFGNWILSGGPKAVFLETTHKGTGHWESKFQNFQFSSFDSYMSDNDFELGIKNAGFLFFYHIGYEMNFAEAFVEGRIGFANGVSAGLNFKLF